MDEEEDFDVEGGSALSMSEGKRASSSLLLKRKWQ